jgi:hypothetical protein
MDTTSESLIPLRDGPTVPAWVCQWLIEAEGRGLLFRIQPDGKVHVGPRARVQPDDLSFIRHHRDAVRACVAYIERLPPC